MLVIPADKDRDARVVHTYGEPFEFARDEVGGDVEIIWITAISTEAGPQACDCTMYVNQEGQPRGLPLNSRATALAELAIGHPIVGDVVIVGPTTKTGRDTSVPEELIFLCARRNWLTYVFTEAFMAGVRADVARIEKES